MVTSPGMLTAHEPEKKSTAKEPEKIANLQIWDTLSPFLDQINVRDKTGWEVVPAGTGRKYSPKGDIVVENEYLTAVFSSKRGKVIIHSKSNSKNRMEFIPLQLKGKSANITSCKILQNTDDRATVEVYFSAKKMNLSAIFSFSKKRIIGVKPAKNMKGISLLSPIEFAVVSGFIGGDLVFDPGAYSSIETLYILSENLFLGLLRGKDGMLVITWPEGKQELRLIPDKKSKDRLFESVDFKNDGKNIYLAILDAPGIWHKEELKSSYMEKDVAIDWIRPFPAKWITQLYEDEVKTTYRFRESKRKSFWRGGVGTYTYPVWFKGENAFYHLGKKIPPKGESLVYFVERSKNTPSSVSTPADILKQTLDSQTYERVLDYEGRKQKSDSRPNPSVGAATCGVTDKLKSIFEAGKEEENKEYIRGGTEDMLYHLTILTERVYEYQDFAHEMIGYLTLMKKDKTEVKPFLDKMENITKEIISAYHHQKENIKTLEYAEELAKKTVALSRKKSSDNLPAFLKLKQNWTGMGGSLEGLNRKLHTTVRKLCMEAGYSAAKQEAAVEIAEEIRRRTKKLLRNPNSYEIWSND